LQVHDLSATACDLDDTDAPGLFDDPGLCGLGHGRRRGQLGLDLIGDFLRSGVGCRLGSFLVASGADALSSLDAEASLAEDGVCGLGHVRPFVVFSGEQVELALLPIVVVGLGFAVIVALALLGLVGERLSAAFSLLLGRVLLAIVVVIVMLLNAQRLADRDGSDRLDGIGA